MGRYLNYRALVIVLAVGPPLVFPLFVAVLWLNDLATGDALLRQHLLFGSRRQLVNQVLTDWIGALPVSYLLCTAILGVGYVLAGITGRQRAWLFALSGTLVAAASFVFLLDGWVVNTTSVSLVTMGALVGAVFGATLQKLGGEA